MRGGWCVVAMVLLDASGARALETVDETIAAIGGGPLAIVDVERKERYRQSVGCLEPSADGGWRLSVPWGIGMPCKPAAKAHPHVAAEIADIQCTAEACVLPAPGTTFQTTLDVAVQREPSNEVRRVQASVSVLRHEPPYLWLAIETSDHESGIVARGVLRAKLYKRVADKVDAASWRPWRAGPSAAEGDL
jgi:hypothetical protein